MSHRFIVDLKSQLIAYGLIIYLLRTFVFNYVCFIVRLYIALVMRLAAFVETVTVKVNSHLSMNKHDKNQFDYFTIGESPLLEHFCLM